MLLEIVKWIIYFVNLYCKVGLGRDFDLSN